MKPHVTIPARARRFALGVAARATSMRFAAVRERDDAGAFGARLGRTFVRAGGRTTARGASPAPGTTHVLRVGVRVEIAHRHAHGARETVRVVTATRAAQAMATAERIVARTTRADGVLDRTVHGVPPVTRVPTMPPMPRVLRRSNASSPEVPNASARASTTAPSAARFGSANMAAETRVGPMPAHEIERVAERVMRTIDDRVRSHRERFGRG